jgi:hypothetical protein
VLISNKTDQTVFVTALNSPNCVTLSGTGEHLQDFLSTQLPPKCRTRATNVRSLYHVCDRLAPLKQTIYEDLQQRCPSMSTSVAFVAPLLSTIDGQPIDCVEAGPLCKPKISRAPWVILGMYTSFPRAVSRVNAPTRHLLLPSCGLSGTNLRLRYCHQHYFGHDNASSCRLGLGSKFNLR